MLWNVHIEDMRRGVHDHLMFGEGEMDFAEMSRRAASASNYRGGVYVELSRHSHDAVETARKALAFLQSGAARSIRCAAVFGFAPAPSAAAGRSPVRFSTYAAVAAGQEQHDEHDCARRAEQIEQPQHDLQRNADADDAAGAR